MMLSSSKHTQNTQSTQPHRPPYKRRTKAISEDLTTLPKTQPEKQLLLTHFLKESTVTEPSLAKYLLTPSTTTDLEQQLKRKDKAIMDLQLKNMSIQADLKKVNNNFCAIINRHKQAFINSQRQLSALHRQKKGQIDPKMGFFRDLATGNFQEGEYLLQIREALQKVQKMKQMYENSHQQQKSCQEETQGQYYQTDYLNYELQHLKEQLSRRERQIELYKARIKLYMREASCQMAKKNWPLLKNRYLTLELIGVGGFGEVYKAIDLETLTHVAIKLSLPDRTESPEANFKRLKYIRRQCETHRKLNHLNIANILDEFESEDRHHCLVMQFCSGPDLATYIKRKGCLPEKEAKGIVKQLVSVAKYLREQKVRVVHYDLKPANILFHNGAIKVIDFGICKTIEDEKSRIALTTPGIGTYWYLPPEVFDENKQFVSEKVDIWSIGIIFFEMLYGKKPYGDGLSQMKILRDGVIVNASEVSFPVQRSLKQPVSAQAQQFIRECLVYEQKDRLGVFQAHEHKYLQEKGLRQ